MSFEGQKLTQKSDQQKCKNTLHQKYENENHSNSILLQTGLLSD